MPLFAGTRSNRAVHYREWRLNRTLYLAAAVLWVLPWAFITIQAFSQPWHEARLMLQSTVRLYGTDTTGIFPFSTIVAGLLGIGLFWLDRTRGQLAQVLEGPVPRRAVLMAKIQEGTLWMLAATIFNTAMMLVLAAITGSASVLGAIVLRSVLITAIDWATLSTALAVGSAVGSVVFVAVATFIWAIGPLLLSSFLMRFWNPPLVPNGPPPPPPMFATVIGHLSAVPPVYPVGGDQLWYGAIFMAWAFVIGTLGLQWWIKAPTEQFDEPFFFPVLWNYLYGVLALFTGYIVDAIATSGQPLSSPGAAFIFVVLGVVGWFFWRRVIQRIGQSSAKRWGPDTVD